MIPLKSKVDYLLGIDLEIRKMKDGKGSFHYILLKLYEGFPNYDNALNRMTK